MRCDKNCVCILCRELHDIEPLKNIKSGEINDNFILRKPNTRNAPIYSIPLKTKDNMAEIANVNPLVDKEIRNKGLGGKRELESNGTPQSKQPANKSGDPGHKVVIYFGDSADWRISHKKKIAENNSKTNSEETEPKIERKSFEFAQKLVEETFQAKMLSQKTSLMSKINEKREISENLVSSPAQRLLEETSKLYLIRKNTPLLERKVLGDKKVQEQRKKVGELKPKKSEHVSEDLESKIKNRNKENSKLAEEHIYQELDDFLEDENAAVNTSDNVISENGVIKISFEENFENAKQLVQDVESDETWNLSDWNGDPVDWSFVQEWRTRPSGSSRADLSYSSGVGSHNIATSNTASGGTPQSGRVHTPATAAPTPRVPKEHAGAPHSPPDVVSTKSSNSEALPATHSAINVRVSPTSVQYGINLNSPNNSNNSITMIPERDTGPSKISPPPCKTGPQRALSGPAKHTSQSTPVKVQPPMMSCGLDARAEARGLETSRVREDGSRAVGGGSRPHHHLSAHELRGMQRARECHSSSDENRSSGHASMSDTGHGSSSPGGRVGLGGRSGALGPLPEDRLAAGVTPRSSRSRASTQHSRSRHRATPAKVPWSGGGLEDIKLAIQQLTMRSHTSTSTYSSLSAGSESSEPARRLARHSSLETVNTNVTSADEFVWVDSHNRLVELQHPPWSQHCVLRVIRSGRCREHSERVSVEAVPRLGYLLQRALVRVAREAQRLSGAIGLCSKHEVAGAFRVVLCPALADSCIKACLRAAAMFAVPGDGALRQSKSSRAGLQLPVGRFHRWMADVRLGKFVHEYAAVYLCAGLENLLEEVLLHSLPSDPAAPLTATGLEHAIAASGDLWGLLQPYAHLNAGRVASGALAMPRWASQSSLGSGSGGVPGPLGPLEPCLLTTCVGALSELRDLVARAQCRSQHAPLSHGALRVLFYFMRCSQLEHGDSGTSGHTIQELCYERAYVVLPPLVEWLRVAAAHAEHRHALALDSDDVMQAARLLLPGVDCPPRSVGCEEALPPRRSPLVNALNTDDPTSECGKRATLGLAFRLMLSGRSDLITQALTMLPPTTRLDTINHEGHTALMIAALRNDDIAITTLLDAGVDPNIETPSSGNSQYPGVNAETQHWTALTYAACRGHCQAARSLLDRAAHVEGGAKLSEDKCTLTPLQVASGSGNLEMVSLLLAHGAHAFLSTQLKDSLCYSGSAQRGCYSAISVAAAHGQRNTLRKLLSHPLAPVNREVLSLEEMLAEGDSAVPRERPEEGRNISQQLSKSQIKSLQEAMYHSAENNHLDITVELRALGVPWTLHCWMHALAAAHELRLDAVIDQLLQDFLQVCPDDYSSQFVQECLPLLFNIFRYSKKEGTTLLLADIFCTCFGWEAIKPIRDTVQAPQTGSRIDPKFVNNPELSDVTFRVEGRVFYGHKIVLVTASPRLRTMLSSKLCDSSPPTVQINDIRYHIFQLVMQFLYSGGCESLDVAPGDVLELMAAASFFQLEGLLRYTEARCSQMLDLDNVVAMYIHSKVYNAVQLLEYCQGFLLQNMVALLTYDDSVKRLLFAKKLPNHDVLGGLLATLQARIKTRRAQNNTVTVRPAPNTPKHK